MQLPVFRREPLRNMRWFNRGVGDLHASCQQQRTQVAQAQRQVLPNVLCGVGGGTARAVAVWAHGRLDVRAHRRAGDQGESPEKGRLRGGEEILELSSEGGWLAHCIRLPHNEAAPRWPFALASVGTEQCRRWCDRRLRTPVRDHRTLLNQCEGWIQCRIQAAGVARVVVRLVSSPRSSSSSVRAEAKA